MKKVLLLLALSSSVVSAKVCVNQNRLCSFWAFKGECAKNPNYMLSQCSAACKQCTTVSSPAGNNNNNRVMGKDSHHYCCFWAGEGECDSNPYWMRVNCQKSCGTSGCSVDNAELCPLTLNLVGCPWKSGNPNTNAAPTKKYPETQTKAPQTTKKPIASSTTEEYPFYETETTTPEIPTEYEDLAYY